MSEVKIGAFVRTPCSSMVKDATSGFFDFTSRLRRSVLLRMTGVGSLKLAICCCLVLTLPRQLYAFTNTRLQSQNTQLPPAPATATPVLQPAPIPLSSPVPVPAQSITNAPAQSPNPSDEIVITAVGDVMLGPHFLTSRRCRRTTA